MSRTRALLLGTSLLLGLSAFTANADRFLADLTGTWEVSVQTPDQAVSSTLTVEQKGDSISGVLASEIGQANVRGVVKGDTVNFLFGLDMGGQAIDIAATALLTDKDNMAGSMDVSGMGNMPFSARRTK
ncbi:MAG TPA: hypothetical protein PKE51_12065 [Gemmatimonadaceae bacterium]|nr:hypothetical protein [Gemmatimonadaceae bacterium]